MVTSMGRLLRRMAAVLVGGVVTSTLLAATSASPTEASPGDNGILTFARFSPSSVNIVSTPQNGSHRRVLVTSPDKSMSVFSDWSPDGRLLVFDRELAGGNVDIYVRRPGGKIIRLTHKDARDAHPAWSPNGKRIVFESDRSGSVQVYVMRRDGSHVRQLTHRRGEALEPSYSPSGRWIAFWSGPVGKTAIYVMHPDGTGLRKLTARSLNAGHPSWSPNGRRIVFSSHAETRNGRIFTIRLGGNGLRQLTKGPNGVEDFEPAYSPNGRLIAFSSFGRNGRADHDADIWVMRSDGTHLRNVASARRGFDIGVVWRSSRDRS